MARKEALKRDKNGNWVNEDGSPLTPDQQSALERLRAMDPNYDESKGFVYDNYSASNQVPENAPSVTLNSTQANSRRAQLGDLMNNLQQQATTGGGAWEQGFRNATQSAVDTTQALGQSQRGADYMSALGNIGNAQAGIRQRAAGQEEILRNQSKMDAAARLGQLVGPQGQLDISQSEASAAARRARGDINNAIQDSEARNKAAAYSAAGSALPMVGSLFKSSFKASDGGSVPGVAPVFGDDERNDVIPALLSPDEVVVPRSVIHSDDPVRNGAKFIRETLEGKHKNAGSGFSGGGPLNFPSPMLPSVENGGMLETGNFDSNRSKTDDVVGRFGQQAKMYSAAPALAVERQRARNASDANIHAAIQAQSSGRSPLGGADLLSTFSGAQAGGAGDYAAAIGSQQSRGQEMLGGLLVQSRAQELDLAKAQQQAALHNEMTNAGIDLQNQQYVRNMISGYGQIPGALKGFFSGPQDSKSNYFDGDDEDEYNNEFGDDGEFAHGGQVCARLGDIKGYADGGMLLPERKDLGPVLYDEAGNPVVRGPFGGDLFKAGGYRPPVALPRPFVSEFAQRDPVEAAGEVPHMPAGKASPLDYVSRLDKSRAGVPFIDAVTKEPVVPLDSSKPVDISFQHSRALTSDPTNPDAAMLDKYAKKFGPPATEVGAPAPIAPQQPASSGIGIPRANAYEGLRDIEQGFSKQNEGAAAQVKAAAQEGYLTGKAIEGVQAGIADKQREIDAINAERMADTKARMDAWQAASDQMQHMDAKINPNRYWANASTPDKVLGIIGLALGALGAGPDGINRAAQMVERAIDRDIEAQKAQFEQGMAKARGAQDSAKTAYSMASKFYDDKVSQKLAAKATLMEGYDLELKKILAGTRGPAEQARLQALIGENQQKLGQIKNQLGNNDFNQRATQANLRMDAAKLGGSGAGHLQPDQKKVVIELDAYNNNLQTNGQKLISLIKQYGTQEKWTPAVEAQMNQLADAMAVDAAKMADPSSVAREGEVALQRKNIFTPGFFQREEAATKAIEAFMQGSEQRKRIGLNARGIR